MDAESTASSTPVSQQEHKAAFFRHSVWVMVATVTGGFFTWGVHFLSKKVSVAEWGTFLALLAITIFIPGPPLQMVMAQQTAAAIANRRERQLAGMIRLIWLGTFALCVVVAIILFFAQRPVMAALQIDNPAALWVALLSVLMMFWMPMFLGIMQGQQNFLWFGWGMILNGLGRVVIAGLIVFTVAASAIGVMMGVVLGLAMTVGVGMWQTKDLWARHAEPFDRQALLKQVLPLMIGFTASQFLFTADMLFVKHYFTPNEAGYYGAAGTLSRALVWLVGPLTSVMFPKIVHSAARAEKSNLMALTLICTAVISGAGVLCLWILGPFVVKLVNTPEFVPVTTKVLPWYASAMLVYCVANVLVSNLLARTDFRIIPAALCLAVGYAITLVYVHSSLVIVLQMAGLFNLGLLLVCAFLTWGWKKTDGPKPEVVS